MRLGSAEERLAEILRRVREQPPEAQEAFKWSIFVSLAEAGWLEPTGVHNWNGKEVYTFREPSSGMRLSAIRPGISAELEQELRKNLGHILRVDNYTLRGGRKGDGKISGGTH